MHRRSSHRPFTAIALAMLVGGAAAFNSVREPSQAAAPDTIPQLRTASSFPIRYWLSLPRQWSSARQWPVVITLDGGNKAWLENVAGFARARNEQGYPFILVTPEILSNGGSDLAAMPQYHYPDSVWRYVARQGRCQFDVRGLHAIVDDIQRLHHGESRYFVTGWSAGGHLTWALVFREPEHLRGAALSGANFNGRCLTNEVPEPIAVSHAPERVKLPIKLLEGSDDPALTSPQPIQAMALARANGYTSITRDTIAGMPHSPMPDQVLAFFKSLLH